jgi:hypothetical protein
MNTNLLNFFTEGNQGNEGVIFGPAIDADVLIVEHLLACEMIQPLSGLRGSESQGSSCLAIPRVRD